MFKTTQQIIFFNYLCTQNKQKLTFMTEQEFEQLWQANRQQLLANDEEYQRISKSYTSSSWLDYLVSIGGFVICEKFIQGFNLGSVWTFLLAALGMVIVWYGFRLIKSRLSSNKTLEEVEQRIKEEYKSTLH